ncbi:MAG TPA: S53 family peptidase [Drouetiella sp.]
MSGDNVNDGILPTKPFDPTREALSQQAFNFNRDDAAPSSAADRYLDVAGRGIAALPGATLDSAVNALTHPLQTAETLGTSAAMGAALKFVLPKGGAAGAIASGVIGGYFLYKGSEDVREALSKAGDAKTMGDIDDAGKQLGHAGGDFITNSAVAIGGYRLGAGVADRVGMHENFDRIAQFKAEMWQNIDNKLGSIKLPGMTSTIGGATEAEVAQGKMQFGARSVGLTSNYRMDGERAHLVNSVRQAPKGAKLVGDVDANETFDVTLLAKTKGNPFLMDRALQRVERGGRTLTDAEIETKFGTDDKAAIAVQRFAEEHGLQIVDETKASGRFILRGNAEQMKTAFQADSLQQFEQNGVTFRARSGTVSVPRSMAEHVTGVLGLDNRPQFKTNYVKLSDLPPDLPGATGEGLVSADGTTVKPKSSGARPLDVEEAMKAYGADPKITGEGMTTGFVSLGGTMPKGWNEFLESKGIDSKLFETRNVGKEAPTPDPKGANGENALDGMIHKFSLPKARTVMVSAPNDDTGMPNAVDRITFPKKGETQITHASISWGSAEPDWTNQALAAMEDAGKRAALKGVTITVAAGDNGAGDHWSGKKQVVDQPSGLKYYTGVGGTLLRLKADGTYGDEKVWSGNGATGGGISMKTPVPDYQAGVKLPTNMNNPDKTGKGVPDIAANGDPRSGWNTFTDEGMEAIGGTSASAPAEVMAAAIISSATGKPTGFWNPQLYRLGKSNPEVFNDVTIGNNTDEGVPGYKAGPGWDATTGWGSVRIDKMIDVLNKQNNQHFAIREARQVPHMIYNNYTHTPVWAIPYNNAPFATSNDKSENK